MKLNNTDKATVSLFAFFAAFLIVVYLIMKSYNIKAVYDQKKEEKSIFPVGANYLDTTRDLLEAFKKDTL